MLSNIPVIQALKSFFNFLVSILAILCSGFDSDLTGALKSFALKLWCFLSHITTKLIIDHILNLSPTLPDLL